MSDEKKLGDFSRPDSVVLPSETPPPAPSPDPEPVETRPVPWPFDQSAEDQPAESAPPAVPPPLTESPPPAEPPRSVDSWDGGGDSWDSAPWDDDGTPEPVFEPPAAALPEDADPDFEDPRRSDHHRREGLSPWLVGLILLLVAALSVAAWWWFLGRAPSGVDTTRQAAAPSLPAPSPPTAVAATEPPPKPELPALDASDEAVRSWIGTLSDHPQLAAWLVPDDLVRRFVAAIDNLSRGESPRPHLGVLEPEGAFAVARRGGLTVVAPEAPARYDLLVEVFASLDIAAGARLFHEVEPLLEEAYLDLGDPSRDFRAALATAIDELLAVRIPEEPPALSKGVLTYRYDDPELEALSPAAKHLLRLGPENARKVQGKLRFFRAALDLPEAG